jgi:hypothetical protein
MRFSQLLVEYDRNQTLNNYGEKVLAAASKDQSIDFAGLLNQFAEPEHTNYRIVLQRNPEAQQVMINYVMGVIEQADPTKNKSYSQAITRLYCFGQTLLEDIASTLSQYLIKFDKLKRKKKIPAPYNDFMRYKSLDEFMTVVEELPDPDSEIEQQKVGALQVPADVQYKVIYGTFDSAMRITSDCVVIVPENRQAGYWWAKEYPKKGVTNRWCTAWEGDNSRFDYYSRQGPLYIIIPARRNDDNEKYQFHFETKQFMDYQDHQIGNQGIDALTQRFPVLMDVFRKQAIEFNILPLMTAEYKNAIKEYAVTASAQLDSLIEQYRDRIAGFGFNSLGDYGITIPEEVKASLMEPIGVYLDQTRQALQAKGGFWDKIREALGSERDENKIEVMLNTDTLLKGAMESSRAGGLVEKLAKEPDIAKRIDPSHLQDLILRDPLFRFIMRQVPKLYKEFLEKLETEAKQGLNESTGLTFMGSPCTKDCSGHQAGYKWSLDRNGRVANGHSQSFNNGTNIAAGVSKKRKQGGGKLPGYVSQTKDAIRKRAARAFAKTTLGQDPNLQEGEVQEHIVKVKGGYELKSKKTGRNLGKYPTKAGAEKRERQVQYFKHMGENVDDMFAEPRRDNSVPGPMETEFTVYINGEPQEGTVTLYPGEFTDVEYVLGGKVYSKTNMENVYDYDAFIYDAKDFIDEIIELNGDGDHFVREYMAEVSLNELAPGAGGGESGRWYTDDEITDIVGDGWWQDMDISGTKIGMIDADVPKEWMIGEAQAWLDDQGYNVQVLNVNLNDDDCDWYIEGNFNNPNFAKKNVHEATFNSKQEVIDHFVKQGKSAAAGAAAWERGWRGSKPKTVAKPKPQQPQQRYWWQDKDDVEEGVVLPFKRPEPKKDEKKSNSKPKQQDQKYKKVDGKMTGPTLHSVYEGRVYYNVIGTSDDQLKSEFSMSKDENGWYLKENVDKRKHANAYRAFGAPKLKEYNLAAFSGDAAIKGEDNIVSPLTKSIKKK